MPKKVKARRLTEAERIEIIKELEQPNPPSKRGISRRYNVNESSIRKLWANKDTVKMRGWINNGGEKPKPVIDRVTPQLETKLYTILDKWIRAGYKAGLPISLHIIRTKATEIANEIKWENFVPSMLREHRLRSLKDLKGVHFCSDSEAEKMELLTATDVLQQEMPIYEPENVYSMVESCLFYSLAPHYTKLFPSENLTTQVGMKKANDRVSLAVCTNVTGTHKLPCTIVRSPTTHMINQPTSCYMIEQKCAWIDSTAFWEWFNYHFYPQVREQTTDPVLLLVEKSPAHYESFHRRNIAVRCIPPSCEGWRQHCQQMITAIKNRYKYFYLDDVLNYKELVNDEWEPVTTYIPCAQPATLQSAAFNIHKAWANISVEVINNCFYKEGFCFQGEVSPGLEDIFSIEDLLWSFEQFSMPLSERALLEFAHIDDFDSPHLCEVIVKELDELLSVGDEDPSTSTSPSSTFDGYKQLYVTSSSIEKQLSCPEAHKRAPKIYDKLKNAHQQLQRILQKANLEEQIGKILLNQYHEQTDGLEPSSQNAELIPFSVEDEESKAELLENCTEKFY